MNGIGVIPSQTNNYVCIYDQYGLQQVNKIIYLCPLVSACHVWMCVWKSLLQYNYALESFHWSSSMPNTQRCLQLSLSAMLTLSVPEHGSNKDLSKQNSCSLRVLPCMSMAPLGHRGGLMGVGMYNKRTCLDGWRWKVLLNYCPAIDSAFSTHIDHSIPWISTKG